MDSVVLNSKHHAAYIRVHKDYQLHQHPHNALLALYQRPWTITNVSSNVIERRPELYGVTEP